MQILRSYAAVAIGAFMLGSCNSSGVGAGSFAPAARVIDAVSTTCSTHPPQPQWIFEGSCKIGVLPAKGATFALAPYGKKKITVSVTLPASNDTGQPFVLVDAIGLAGNDIKPWEGLPFPGLNSHVLHTLIYVQAISHYGCVKPSAKCNGLIFKGNATFTVGATSFPAKTCFFLDLVAVKGQGLEWNSTPESGKVQSGTVKIVVPASELNALFKYGLPRGPSYFLIACANL